MNGENATQVYIKRINSLSDYIHLLLVFYWSTSFESIFGVSLTGCLFVHFLFIAKSYAIKMKSHLNIFFLFYYEMACHSYQHELLDFMRINITYYNCVRLYTHMRDCFAVHAQMLANLRHRINERNENRFFDMKVKIELHTPTQTQKR